MESRIPFQKEAAGVMLAGVFFCLVNYGRHCTWVTSEAYSSPSIVLQARGGGGRQWSLMTSERRTTGCTTTRHLALG